MYIHAIIYTSDGFMMKLRPCHSFHITNRSEQEMGMSETKADRKRERRKEIKRKRMNERMEEEHKQYSPTSMPILEELKRTHGVDISMPDQLIRH